MKTVLKRLLYLTPIVLTLSVTLVDIAKIKHDNVHFVGGVPTENVIAGIIPIVLCIILTIVCFVAIKKKFADDNIEIKNIKVKNILLIVLNILIILLGLSFAVMYFNA